MATISFNRASHQHIRQDIPCGKAKSAHPNRPSAAYLTPVEHSALNRAVDLLRQAQNASSHASCMIALTSALSLVRKTATDNK